MTVHRMPVQRQNPKSHVFSYDDKFLTGAKISDTSSMTPRMRCMSYLEKNQKWLEWNFTRKYMEFRIAYIVLGFLNIYDVDFVILFTFPVSFVEELFVHVECNQIKQIRLDLLIFLNFNLLLKKILTIKH